LSILNNPFLLGFDELDDLMGRVTKSADGFPPYNLEQVDAEVLRITVAVAGYTADDLEMTLEDNQLIIRGAQTPDPTRRFLHRGIAGRSFVKSFIMADGMVVDGACLENGLLSVDLRKPIKQAKVQKIAIKTDSKPVLIDAGRRKK